ncbi:hypothetical protein HHL19_35410 [Streptomyces sp. R302]|uniref:hypothetical protein n=1 Tax=unclassified Streptomyces TaxID=2593676 RepID=UPI00145D93F2|nr:hypothetical protein [Streptomyces sp. R301]NML83800.1 hypothetical protein [Streptomyces sp. R302]
MIEKQFAGLAADLEALTVDPGPQKGPRCSVAAYLDTVDADTAALLRTVLDNPTVQTSHIAKTLARHGVQITAPTVGRHRRRGEPNGCRCER